MEKNKGELKLLAPFSASLLSGIHHSCVSRMFSNPFLILSDENKLYAALFHLLFSWTDALSAVRAQIWFVSESYAILLYSWSTLSFGDMCVH